MLQIADLHGDIIATASLSETETKLLSTADTTEYGVPRTSTPPKYSWLGAEERPTELPSGAIAMGARSYIPQLGRFLQTDPIPGGSANAYAYTDGDPVNSADPSGAYSSIITYGNLSEVSTGPGIEIPEGHDTVPGALMPPPVNLQIEEAFAANPPWAAASIFNSAPAEEEYEEESIEFGVPDGGVRPRFVTFPATGCTRGPCHGHAGNPNEGSAGSCRSGGSRNRRGECQEGHGDVPNDCEAVGSLIGGTLGGVVPGVGLATGGAGAATGAAAGKAACGGSET